MKKLLMLMAMLVVMLFAVSAAAEIAMADDVVGVWKAVAGDKLRENQEEYFCFTGEAYYRLTIREDYEFSGSVPKPYHVEAETIVVGENGRFEYLAYQLNGDNMTLWLTARNKYELARVEIDSVPLIGTWEMSGAEGDWDNLPEMAYLTFTETSVAMSTIVYGEVESQRAFYVNRGPVIELYNEYSDYQRNATGFSDDAFHYQLEGDTLTIRNLGRVIHFTRKLPEPNAVPLAQQLIGEWEMIISEEEKLNLVLTGKTMAMFEMDHGDVNDATAWFYYVVGNTIVTEDYGWSFEVDGDVFTLSNWDEVLIFSRKNNDPAELAELIDHCDRLASEETGLLGKWNLSEISGEDEAAESWGLVQALGASIYLTITEDTVALSTSVFGETETEITNCNIYDRYTIILENGNGIEMDNDVLYLQKDGVTMEFTKEW